MQDNNDNTILFDKKQVRRSFNRAVATYDESAVLQREVASRMLERLDYIKLEPQVVLDVGAGTGFATAQLHQRYKQADVYALDISESMLQRACTSVPWYQRLRRKIRPVCADAEQLPLASNSVDFIFSSLTLQWCNDLQRVFAEFRRVLRPGGMLLFSTFGPDTLKELRASWLAAGDTERVSQFIDMHDIGDAMLHAGLAEPVMDMEAFTLTYPDVYSLMRDLKAIGATSAGVARTQGLTTKARMQAMADRYEHYRHDGVLPASYEVVYGHAWCGESIKPGRQVIAVESLRGGAG